MTTYYRQLTTLAVIDRWLRVKAQVAEQAQAARNAVIAAQLRQIRATAP